MPAAAEQDSPPEIIFKPSTGKNSIIPGWRSETVPPDKYKCPNCGKMVTFGEHFCLVNGGSGDESPADSPKVSRNSDTQGTLKRIGVILVVATLTGAMLWPFLGIYAMFAGLIVLAGISVGISLLTRRQNNGGSCYRELLSMVGGQKDVAERLIAAEERKYPSMTRPECVRRVHDRLEYEHSR
jgi:hypothetical protein